MSKLARRMNLARARDYLVKKMFNLCQELGFHITLNHFYSPIPDTRLLKDNLWTKPSELVGLNINEKEQLKLLTFFSSHFKIEYDAFPTNKTPYPYEYYIDNPNFGSVDAEILWCIIRHFKPHRILEIGSGFSTLLSAQAILKNKQDNNNYECELVTIDPYPNKIIENGFPGLSKVIPKKVQDVSLTEFQKLQKNDILFIDSSHVLKIGNDVQYEYLEVLPRLNKGVIVHSHDIFLPVEYHKNWVLKDHVFWNEQYLLQSFLTFNDTFEVLWAGTYMHLNNPEQLQKAFRSYKREMPASFWIRRIK